MDSRREQRRREQQALTAPAPGNVRPTYAPRELPADDPRRCPAKLGAVHDFSSRDRLTVPGSTLFRCWYCWRLSPRSLERFVEWRAQERNQT
jgi:hypothetical protein